EHTLHRDIGAHSGNVEVYALGHLDIEVGIAIVRAHSRQHHLDDGAVAGGAYLHALHTLAELASHVDFGMIPARDDDAARDVRDFHRTVGVGLHALRELFGLARRRGCREQERTGHSRSNSRSDTHNLRSPGRHWLRARW